MLKKINDNKKLVLGTAILAVGVMGGVQMATNEAEAAKPQAVGHEKVVETETVQNLAENKHFINVNGKNIYYNAKITNPNQKTIVMIHGAGAFAESWSQVTSKFTSDEFNYIALDMPGHLRSGGEAFMTIDENADFINDFVHAIKADYGLKNDFTLVGHSFGGAVTGEVATRHYEWLKSVILVGTSSDFTNTSSPEFIENLKNGELDLDFYKRGFSPASPSILYDVTIGLIANVSLKATYADFYATTLYNNTNEFSKINKDTLIISGNDDIIMPKDASKIMHDKIKKSTWVQVPNAGHFITTEAPAAVAKAIEDFVTKK